MGRTGEHYPNEISQMQIIKVDSRMVVKRLWRMRMVR
jgi:hypothetical protein